MINPVCDYNGCNRESDNLIPNTELGKSDQYWCLGHTPEDSKDITFIGYLECGVCNKLNYPYINPIGTDFSGSTVCRDCLPRANEITQE